MEQKTLPVSEIFYSIDGEGCRTGAPAIFIRLFGCNLHCSYCDTRYACEKKHPLADLRDMTIDEIVDAVKEYEPCRCITITGGEPLIHKPLNDLITRLRELCYWVNIETNGSIDLNEIIQVQGAKRGDMDYFFTMDWKSISSGESDKMIVSNLEWLTNLDVLKFVVGDEIDLHQMKDLLERYPEIDAQIYVSPIWGRIEPAELVRFILENKLVYVKVQVQLHKIIWDPNTRGV